MNRSIRSLLIAAVALVLLYSAGRKIWGGHIPADRLWIVAAIGTLGLSALIEAIWPEGNHGLLQFWCLTVLAASAIVSWIFGAPKALGILGLVLFAVSFVIAVWFSANTRLRSKE